MSKIKVDFNETSYASELRTIGNIANVVIPKLAADLQTYGLVFEQKTFDAILVNDLKSMALLLINIGENIFICQIKAYSLITC